MKRIYEGKATGVTFNGRQENLARIADWWQVSTVFVEQIEDPDPVKCGLEIILGSVANRNPKKRTSLGWVPSTELTNVYAKLQDANVTAEHISGRIRSIGQVATEKGATWGFVVELYIPGLYES